MDNTQLVEVTPVGEFIEGLLRGPSDYHIQRLLISLLYNGRYYLSVIRFARAESIPRIINGVLLYLPYPLPPLLRCCCYNFIYTHVHVYIGLFKILTFCSSKRLVMKILFYKMFGDETIANERTTR